MIDVSEGYICFLVNPSSGASSGGAMISHFKGYLRGRGYDVRAIISKSMEHICELARAGGADDDCRLVVACGGDGTVREAVQGMEGSETPLMIIPCGTENLLASELGYDERASTLIRAFEGDSIRSLDIGKANGQCFTCITSFGFDGDVVKRVMARRCGHISHLDYFWPTWRTFWSYTFPAVRVTVDGEQIFDGRGLVFVGNISRYAIGLGILQKADYSDGLLDVCAYKCSNQMHLLKHSAMTLLKRHIGMSDVVYRQGKNVEVVAPDGGIIAQVDGDPGPSLPIKIEVVPGAVKVVVPPGAKPAGIRTRIIRALG